MYFSLSVSALRIYLYSVAPLGGVNIKEKELPMKGPILEPFNPKRAPQLQARNAAAGLWEGWRMERALV